MKLVNGMLKEESVLSLSIYGTSLIKLSGSSGNVYFVTLMMSATFSDETFSSVLK